MPQHTRRPPAPPAPEFYIADPQPPRAADAPPEAPAAPVAPREPAPERERQPPKPAASHVPARAEQAGGWHQSEPWVVAMLVSFAIMLVAIYVPGTVKLVLIGLSALTALAGIVMLVRQGLFDEPTTDD